MLVALALASSTACGAAGTRPAERPSATPAEAHAERATDPEPAGRARPAASQPVIERPRALVLPSGTVLPVDVSRTAPSGQLALPDDVGRAGWWDGGARLGDLFGTIVLAAHVDSFADGIGPIAELLSARPGQHLTLRSRSLDRQFVITSVRFIPRVSLAEHGDLMTFGAARRLVVITCGGPYGAAYGGYRDNLVVIAVPSGGG